MDTMLDEVDAQTTHIDMLTEIVEAARQPDDNGRDRRNDLLQRVISLPERVDALKKLSEVEERVRRGEREAFGITVEPTGQTNAVAALLATLGRSSLPVAADEES